MQIKIQNTHSLPLSSPVIIAPMAGITNLPYRRIMKSFGAGLVFSEMVSANGLIRDGKKTRELLRTHTDEAPLGIQLFGDDPAVLAQAAAMVINDGALLDINMGCPVKKVIRSGAGSALLKTPQTIAKICAAVRTAYPGPLTIKIRSGWDETTINYLKIGHIAQEEGINAITLHPRTRTQGFSGQANWQHIAELKNSINIPVFGSGDIVTPDDALKMFTETQCDGVMIGRGGYGNPWLIANINELLNGQPLTIPGVAEKCTVALKHIEMYEDLFGERKTLLDMRKHLCWYARGLQGASHYRVTLQKTDNLKQAIELTTTFFSQASLEE